MTTLWLVAAVFATVGGVLLMFEWRKSRRRHYFFHAIGALLIGVQGIAAAWGVVVWVPIVLSFSAAVSIWYSLYLGHREKHKA